MKEIKKLQAKGLYDKERSDPFELFCSSTTIRWTYYKELHRVLGTTWGMCVLQDFEAVTPNILCRAIETVEGGGVVVLLLRSMASLRQLYTLTMDAHARFRTEAHGAVVAPRFNERFLLSLVSNPACLVLDDELNILPVSRHAARIVPLPGSGGGGGAAGGGVGVGQGASNAAELEALKGGLAGTELVGAVVKLARTLDQARAVLTFCEAISVKTLRGTVALTAGRGRGKSAALGLAIAAAAGYGFSNVLVTAPSPENLGTLFEFIVKGLVALGFRENDDFNAVASTNPEWAGAVVRVDLFRGHRQTVAFVLPADAAARVGSAELLVVDEAASIPLPVVKRMMGAHLTFLASTVNGYEGTGRSLSLKLLSGMRVAAAGGDAGGGGGGGGAASGAAAAAAVLKEVVLEEPIRYGCGDPVERWLNELLCLDATTAPKLRDALPPPSECSLLAVDRDALFSYHRLSEAFLHNMMALYVSSHYKNSPNDLQLMSDAPAHRLYVLLGPQRGDGGGGEVRLPDILCVVQVCLEGEISRESAAAALASGGARAAGDLIPWTLTQQFQDDRFASLSGARVVRIATHPDALKMNYGSRALELLRDFYLGRLVAFGEGDEDAVHEVDTGRGGRDEGGDGALLVARKEHPPLLVPLSDMRPPPLHWLGVSYGLTLPLFNFWHKGGYKPVYIRQTQNDVTSENTVVMLLELRDGLARSRWSEAFVADFQKRFLALLGCPELRGMELPLALSVLGAASAHLRSAAGGGGEGEEGAPLAAAPAEPPSPFSPPPLAAHELGLFFTPHDLRRLDAYNRGQIDYHTVLDLLPDAARLALCGRVPALRLPHAQVAILVGVGLQRNDVAAVATGLGLQVNQALALLGKAMKRVAAALNAVVEASIAAEVDAAMQRGEEALQKGRLGGGGGGGRAAKGGESALKREQGQAGLGGGEQTGKKPRLAGRE
jgi:N-acetyltransferase 10